MFSCCRYGHTVPYNIPYMQVKYVYVRYLELFLFKYEVVWYQHFKTVVERVIREANPYPSLQTTSLGLTKCFDKHSVNLSLWILVSTFNPRWQHLCRTVRSVRTGISGTLCHTYHSIPFFKIAIQWQAYLGVPVMGIQNLPSWWTNDQQLKDNFLHTLS